MGPNAFRGEIRASANIACWFSLGLPKTGESIRVSAARRLRALPLAPKWIKTYLFRVHSVKWGCSAISANDTGREPHLPQDVPRATNRDERDDNIYARWRLRPGRRAA